MLGSGVSWNENGIVKDALNLTLETEVRIARPGIAR